MIYRVLWDVRTTYTFPFSPLVLFFFFFTTKVHCCTNRMCFFFSITVAAFMGNVNGSKRDKHKNRKQKKKQPITWLCKSKMAAFKSTTKVQIIESFRTLAVWPTGSSHSASVTSWFWWNPHIGIKRFAGDEQTRLPVCVLNVFQGLQLIRTAFCFHQQQTPVRTVKSFRSLEALITLRRLFTTLLF